MDEMFILKLLGSPSKIHVLRTLNILFVDRIGQLSAEILSVLDIKLRKIFDNNIVFGGILLIATIDHTQLHPVKGLPFILSSHTLACFKMIMLADLIQRKSKWTDYMEQGVGIVILNSDEANVVRIMTQKTFPFRV